jgi:negative regulator of flagellin synthesis FlgM
VEITGKNSTGNILTHVHNESEKKRINLPTRQGSPGKAIEDKVELSPRAREILETTKQIHYTTDIDIEKVSKLKQQIDTGSYQIDGQKIAYQMLRESVLNQMVFGK